MISYQSCNGKPASPAVKFFFARIFPYPFVILGGLVLFFGVRNILHAGASTSWPTVSGVVRDSGVESESGENGATYHARIWYEYTADGIKHSGSRVAFGDYGSSDPSHAQNIVNRYPVGMGVTVHYLSSNPDESVIETGVKSQAYFVPMGGLVFLTMGLLMAVFLPRVFRNSQAAKIS